jgi:Zinc knuckle
MEPTLMEVDAAWRRWKPTSTCHRCGQTGHFIRDCPHAYDVHFMDVEEIKSLVEQLLSEGGVEPMTEEAVDVKEEREAEEGDFGRSSE